MRARSAPSAIGERQMLPRQTISSAAVHRLSHRPAAIQASARARSSGVSTPGGNGSGVSADRDAVAGFEHAQLFQRFDLLQPSRRQRREALQEPGAIAVDADMAQPLALLRHAAAVAGEGVARPRNRRAAEVQRIAVAGTHQLHRVGIEQRLDVGRSASPASPFPRLDGASAFGDGADAGRRRERFVALQVDHDRVVAPAGDARAFGQAIGAGGVRRARSSPRARRCRRAPAAMRSSSAATQTSRAPAASARRATCSDQRLAGEQAQRLAGQARGGVARRDGDDEIGIGALQCSWRPVPSIAPAFGDTGRALLGEHGPAARPRTLPATRRAPAR